MDREQRRSSIVLLPLCEFEGIDRSEDSVVQDSTVAYYERCANWISVSTFGKYSLCEFKTH